jgi:hypothetical protein
MKDLKAGGNRIELPEAGGVTDESLRNFFQEAEAVKAEMVAIRDSLDHLDAANEEGKSLHQADAFVCTMVASMQTSSLFSIAPKATTSFGSTMITSFGSMVMAPRHMAWILLCHIRFMTSWRRERKRREEKQDINL